MSGKRYSEVNTQVFEFGDDTIVDVNDYLGKSKNVVTTGKGIMAEVDKLWAEILRLYREKYLDNDLLMAHNVSGTAHEFIRTMIADHIANPEAHGDGSVNVELLQAHMDDPESHSILRKMIQDFIASIPEHNVDPEAHPDIRALVAGLQTRIAELTPGI